MKIREFSIEFSRQNIYRAIGCFSDNPARKEVEERYDTVCGRAYGMIRPCACLVFGRIPRWAAEEKAPEDRQALYVMTTVGGQISEWSSALLAEGDSVAGMLADAMADDYLSQMETALKDTVVSVCRKKGFGIAGCLRTPEGISPELRRAALEAVQMCEETDIKIKGGLQYDPVKTACQVYVLREGAQEYLTKPGGGVCLSSGDRKEPVRVRVQDGVDGGGSVCILCREGQSVHQALTEAGVYLSAVCGGRGTCGKCGIRVLEGDIPVSEADERFYTEEERKDGMRLACKAYPKTECSIMLRRGREEDICAVADCQGGSLERRGGENGKETGIAVDIGTTTLAMLLVYLESGETIDTYTAINRQRVYGADVVSRILAANQGSGSMLRESIVNDLMKGVHTLLKRNGMEQEKTQVRKISIAGNTTMLHLLLGYSCEALGAFPFRPVCIDTVRLDWTGLTGESRYQIPVAVMPGISAYVGADIVSGILACGMERSEEVTLLLDLGTNGEIAVGSREWICCTSTAAGPAFEGGNISHGMGSVPGAICNVKITDGKACVKTVRGETPSGICGTGVVETVYELFREGLIDNTGLMDDAYFESGFVLARNADGGDIIFTQKDVREFQLAKSAVRAGIETLLLHAGVEAGEVARIYVAGGFGCQMDFDKAISIGLLPKAFAGRITSVGNSSLYGALQYLVRADAADETERIRKKTTEVSLAGDDFFSGKYMEYMYFGADSEKDGTQDFF